jgi:hypothetical protein
MLALKLGIAGTAKNTGKTTTTASIMQELRMRGVAFYLTSIGYDGENLDNVTGLPKPKLQVETGDIVATAEKCIDASTAAFDVLLKTDISTPLGKISIVKVKRDGLAVTAGPNKSSEVRELAVMLEKLGPGVTIFDGALSRIAPMVETDGFVLATGAARTPDIPRLAAETGLIYSISTLPTVPQAIEITGMGLNGITLLDASMAEIKKWPQTSLLAAKDVGQIVSKLNKEAYLYIPGIIGEQAFKVLIGMLSEKPCRFFLVFADPIKLLVAGSPDGVFGMIEEIERLGVIVGVLKRIPLFAVTINPFFPEYRVEAKAYQPAFVDFSRLQIAVGRNVKVPVYNVVRQGASGLVDAILANARRWEDPGAFRL